jgi:hypothetical protein
MPVQTALRSSGATAPTMIRKWIVAPVDLEKRSPDAHVSGRWVGRPGIARHVHNGGAEQNTKSSDDKHSAPLIWWYAPSERSL